jgi:hypothetical protein
MTEGDKRRADHIVHGLSIDGALIAPSLCQSADGAFRRNPVTILELE